MNFCNFKILFIHLVTQFDFDLMLLMDISRITYHMIKCDIKIFKDLMKQYNVTHFWIIIIWIMIIYVDLELIKHLQFKSNTLIIINDVYHRK